MRILTGLWLFALTVSCTQQRNRVELTFEKDLIPEGIAIDPHAKKVYLNSLRLDKIVRCDLDGSHAENFIASNQYDYLSGFGMTVKGDTLFALGNVLPKANNKSILLLLNTVSKELIASYTLENDHFIYLNDLAVDAKGTVYITDSESNDIYTVNETKGSLEVFFASDEIKHCNGITISPDGKLLYLASYTSGVRILDIASKKLLNRPNGHKGIDGLKCYRNSLFAIVNARRDPTKNGVFRFALNGQGTEIIKADKMLEFEKPSDIPTTFAIYGDSMYFVSDSQMDNFDQESNDIIAPERLENYRLVRQKL
ncbi:MAG: SMP-30/gluconolactonase/LRE family protein [Allomuricauda sp.]